jgi:ACT domain-containing protein
MSSTNTDTKKKQMIEALKKTLGNVSAACGQVGISRNTHYDYIESICPAIKKKSRYQAMTIDSRGKIMVKIYNNKR